MAGLSLYYVSLQNYGTDYFMGADRSSSNAVIRPYTTECPWIFAKCAGDTSTSHYWFLEANSGQCLYGMNGGGLSLHACTSSDNVYSVTRYSSNDGADVIGSSYFSNNALLEMHSNGLVDFAYLGGYGTNNVNTTQLPYFQWAVQTINQTGTNSLPNLCGSSVVTTTHPTTSTPTTPTTTHPTTPSPTTPTTTPTTTHTTTPAVTTPTTTATHTTPTTTTTPSPTPSPTSSSPTSSSPAPSSSFSASSSSSSLSSSSDSPIPQVIPTVTQWVSTYTLPLDVATTPATVPQGTAIAAQSAPTTTRSGTSRMNSSSQMTVLAALAVLGLVQYL